MLRRALQMGFRSDGRGGRRARARGGRAERRRARRCLRGGGGDTAAPGEQHEGHEEREEALHAVFLTKPTTSQPDIAHVG